MPSPLIKFAPMPTFSDEEIAELQAAADSDDRTPVAGELVRRIFQAIEANTSLITRLSSDLETTQALAEALRGDLQEAERAHLEAVHSAEIAREERDELQATLDRQVNELYEASQTAQGNLREALAQETRTSESLRAERDDTRAALGRARDAVRDAGKALAPVLSTEYAEEASTAAEDDVPVELATVRAAFKQAAHAAQRAFRQPPHAEETSDDSPRIPPSRFIYRGPRTIDLRSILADEEGR